MSTDARVIYYGLEPLEKHPMFQWQDDPPAPTEFAGVRLMRVPAGRRIEAIITSHKLRGLPTHFAHRRTQPCTGPDCELCSQGVPARWHGYLSIWSTRSNVQSVLELTALAAAPIKEYQLRHGTIRGASLEAERRGNKANSPVQTQLAPTDLDKRTLPREINLQRFFETLWKLTPQPEDGQAKPPRGPNIRNTLGANTPTCTTQTSPSANGNGGAP